MPLYERASPIDWLVMTRLGASVTWSRSATPDQIKTPSAEQVRTLYTLEICGTMRDTEVLACRNAGLCANIFGAGSESMYRDLLNI